MQGRYSSREISSSVFHCPCIDVEMHSTTCVCTQIWYSTASMMVSTSESWWRLDPRRYGGTASAIRIGSATAGQRIAVHRERISAAQHETPKERQPIQTPSYYLYSSRSSSLLRLHNMTTTRPRPGDSLDKLNLKRHTTQRTTRHGVCHCLPPQTLKNTHGGYGKQSRPFFDVALNRPVSNEQHHAGGDDTTPTRTELQTASSQKYRLPMLLTKLVHSIDQVLQQAQARKVYRLHYLHIGAPEGSVGHHAHRRAFSPAARRRGCRFSSSRNDRPRPRPRERRQRTRRGRQRGVQHRQRGKRPRPPGPAAVALGDGGGGGEEAEHPPRPPAGWRRRCCCCCCWPYNCRDRGCGAGSARQSAAAAQERHRPNQHGGRPGGLPPRHVGC